MREAEAEVESEAEDEVEDTQDGEEVEEYLLGDEGDDQSDTDLFCLGVED